jgi:phage baseplate assembly protein gpV
MNIKALFRHGQATERDVNSATARVAMDDLAGQVSGKLQILFPAVGGWNIFFTPKQGDHVITSKHPNGKQEGLVIGKVYTANKMPQGGAPDIILAVSDDGRNVVRLDAINGTLDIIFDQTGNVQVKNLAVEVKQSTDLVTHNLDVESATPIGFQGTGTQLGADVLVAFFTNLKKAVKRNPIKLPPIEFPPVIPVPPIPVMINMFLNALCNAIAEACDAAIIACNKTLK